MYPTVLDCSQRIDLPLQQLVMNLANVILKVYLDMNTFSAITLNPLCKIECPMVSMNSQNLLGMKDHPNVKTECVRLPLNP